MIPNINIHQVRRVLAADLDMHVRGCQQRLRGDKKPSKSLVKLKDLRAMLRIIFSSFVKCCEEEGFIVLHRNGEKILYKPFICLIIGDTCGNNEFCYHHNSSENNHESVCICNKYKCKFADLSKVPRLC